jgi:hypothetical protein
MVQTAIEFGVRPNPVSRKGFLCKHLRNSEAAKATADVTQNISS